MRDTSSKFQLRLPGDLFQDKDALAAIRAAGTLADVARVLALRVGLFMSAAMVASEAKLRAGALDALSATGREMSRFLDFLRDPCAEGEVHPVVLPLLRDAAGGTDSRDHSLRRMADFALAAAEKGARMPLGEDDLSAMTEVAHRDFPKWEAAFRQRLEVAGAAAKAELEDEVAACRRRARGSQERIEEIARLVRLIALNARVEAARAGASGHAFGVIADEIKSLSEQTSAASADMRRDIERMTTLLASGV